MWTVNLAFHWSQYNLICFVLTSIKETVYGLSHVFDCIFILCTHQVDFLWAELLIQHWPLRIMIDKTQANMVLDRRLTAAKIRIRCSHSRHNTRKWEKLTDLLEPRNKNHLLFTTEVIKNNRGPYLCEQHREGHFTWIIKQQPSLCVKSIRQSVDRSLHVCCPTCLHPTRTAHCQLQSSSQRLTCTCQHAPVCFWSGPTLFYCYYYC